MFKCINIIHWNTYQKCNEYPIKLQLSTEYHVFSLKILYKEKKSRKNFSLGALLLIFP